MLSHAQVVRVRACGSWLTGAIAVAVKQQSQILFPLVFDVYSIYRFHFLYHHLDVITSAELSFWWNKDKLETMVSISDDIYRQYHIGFWGTRYNINSIISSDIMATIADLFDTDIDDIDTGNHWPILIVRF